MKHNKMKNLHWMATAQWNKMQWNEIKWKTLIGCQKRKEHFFFAQLQTRISRLRFLSMVCSAPASVVVSTMSKTSSDKRIYMCVYISIYMHTYMYMCVYEYVYTHTYRYMYIYIYIYTSTCIYMYIYIFLYIRTYIFIHICIYIYIYIHVYMYMCI